MEKKRKPMRKQYFKPLSRVNVWVIFIGIMLVGMLFLYIQDVRFILAGFGIFTVGLHEFGHLLALRKKHYDVVGIVISIIPPGIGPVPERPISPNDSTSIYFSGLIALIVAFYLMLYTVEVGILFLLGTILLSTMDIWNWWQINK
jgi:hypothetical protein